jgi:hypothetical protein
MSEGMKIALTAFATVFTFVIGQLIQRIFIEPLHEQRRVIGRIAHALTFYRGICEDGPPPRATPERVADVRSALRALAADLRSTLTGLPWYSAFSCVRLALPRVTIKQVAYRLMRWELFMSEKAAADAVTEVAELLKIDYIKNEWTEFQEMMGVKVSEHPDNDGGEAPVKQEQEPGI